MRTPPVSLHSQPPFITGLELATYAVMRGVRKLAREVRKRQAHYQGRQEHQAHPLGGERQTRVGMRLTINGQSSYSYSKAL